MKGLSELDLDKIRNCETIREMLDRIQCLYGGNSHVAQEEVEEPWFSSNEPEHGKVASRHTLVDDDEVSKERPCFLEGILLLCDKCKEIGH